MDEVGYPLSTKPHIQWNHTDGPLLCCRDGTPYWLTGMDRLRLYFGQTTVEQLERSAMLGAAQPKEAKS